MKAAAVAIALLALHAGSAQVLAEPPRARKPAAQQTVDLDLKQADIRNVLRLLAELGNVNLVYGEEITGEITIRLHGVTWNDAMRVVLASMGLEMVHEGNIVRVASAETLAAERKAELDAHEQCLQSAPLKTRLVRVSYARAAEMAQHIKATLSPRGTVSVDERTNTVIVRDVDCP